ncbi:GNAT family N-acetyltransferase [Streptomyces sp. NPDC050548]|uniref:GNAT family N-acetyltransferase n=1 Tax=Streptomyces sp. NPDC050548 TaxID=3365629 RepID=UPI0037A5238D
MPREVHAVLADGSDLWIRPARPGDREQVLRLYQGLSMESLRFRFFGPSRRLVERAAAKACSPPRDGYLALVADDGRRIVGISEYETAVGQSCDQRCAEMALVVADDWHRRGVGRLLVEELVSAARAGGVRRFTADALAENRAVLLMFHDLGLPVSWRPDGTEVHCTLSLEQDEDCLSVADARERLADVTDIRPPLCASPVAVPAPQALAEATEQRGRPGIRSLVTVAHGLGAAEVSALSSEVRARGTWLLGPNRSGTVDTDTDTDTDTDADADADVRMDAVSAGHRPPLGTAWVAVRSGGVGIALLGGLSPLGIGVTTFVSLGDAYEVSSHGLPRSRRTRPAPATTAPRRSRGRSRAVSSRQGGIER